MTGEIRLSGLRAFGYHGVFDSEKRTGQDFFIDVRMLGDFSAAAASDDLRDTIDYGAVANTVVEIVTRERFDLIEALAARIADALAHSAPGVRVEVTVHKPSAPIEHDFADVSVTAHREHPVHSEHPAEAPAAEVQPTPPQTAAPQPTEPARITAILSLGANEGDPIDQLRGALDALARHPRISSVRASDMYASAPVGGVEQDDFVNCAAVVEAELAPRELLAVAQGIELALGRVRTVHWGPRTLDIDIVRITPAGADPDDPACELRSTDPVLTLPHPWAHERAFVLVPWAQLRPGAQLEAGGRLVSAAERARAVQAADPAQTVRVCE